MKAAARRALAAARRVWLYLLLGSDELVLPKSWLANRDRMRGYVGYTRRQLQQGAVVTTAEAWRQREQAEQDAARQRAFWAEVEAKQKEQERTANNTLPFRKVKG